MSCVVVWGPGLARAHGLDPTLSGLTRSDLDRDPAQAAARLRPHIETAAKLPEHPALNAALRLLEAHPGGGVVSLALDGWPKAVGLHPVVELYGSLREGRCAPCGHGPVDFDAQCPACGGWVRPNVVLGDEVVEPRRRLEAEFLIGRAQHLVLVGAAIHTPGVPTLLELGRTYGLSLQGCRGPEAGELPEDVIVRDGPLEDTLAALYD